MKRGGGSSTRVWCGAAGCFDEACEGRAPEARLRKALLMISGIPDEAEEKETLPGTPADPAGALRLLRDLAGTGYLPADRELGRMILRDAALRQSCGTEARQSLTRAADSGDVESLLMLAACYEDGVGGAGDAKEAVACYERVVKLGSAEAKVPLAAAYEYGLGVAPDPGPRLPACPGGGGGRQRTGAGAAGRLLSERRSGGAVDFRSAGALPQGVRRPVICRRP